MSDPLDPEKVRRLAVMLLGKAAEARRDPAAFLEFVMRRENSDAERGTAAGDPIKCAPHQRLLFEFIMAHHRSLLFMPVEHAKSFSLGVLTLWILGNDPSAKCAVVSASQAQAEKVVRMARDYIESSLELRMVFPKLRRSPNKGDPWTHSELLVERPSGGRDYSLAAFGQDTKRILGSRLSWVVVDDLMNSENTGTKEQRRKLLLWFDQCVLSRLLPNARVVLSNTVWHPEDLFHVLEKDFGWASLRMDVEGYVRIRDDRERAARAATLGEEFKPWDSELLRPAHPHPSEERCRLVAHDPDPRNVVPLWPEEWPRARVEKKRLATLPYVFGQNYLGNARDDNEAMCKQAYVDTCFEVGRMLGVRSFVNEYKGPHPVFAGVDLAIGLGDEHDDTAIYVFEVRPGGRRVLLNIVAGKWPVTEIRDRIIDTYKRYKANVRVETVAAQDYVRQIVLEKNIAIPIDGMMTDSGRAHPENGVPGIFLEMSNGAWAWPVGVHGEVHPLVRRLADACLDYTPQRHVDDVLMAMWMGVERAKSWGLMGCVPEGSREEPVVNAQQRTLGMSLLAR